MMTAYFVFCRFDTDDEVRRGIVVAEGAWEALHIHADACKKAIKDANEDLAREPEITGVYCEACEKHQVYPVDIGDPVWQACNEMRRGGETRCTS